MRLKLGVAVIAFVLVSACGGSSNKPVSCAKAATSVTDCGGISDLFKVAKAEGQLNVIALPPDWVNYGVIFEAFKTKYPGIKVNSVNPNATSKEEIDAIKAGGVGAPDVVDIGLQAATANASLFAPYKVATWNDIPSGLKAPTSVWVSDYGGYMSIGYDPAKVPGGAINSMADLLGPGFKSKVALAGDPTNSPEALNGLIMASVANGGTVDDVSKGVDFFHQLKVAGNFVRSYGTSVSVKSGLTSVVFEWDYRSAFHTRDIPGWKIFEPPNAIIGGFYVQAINKAAPHPAAARLWEEFLFSDAAQNLWLIGGAHPSRQAALEKSGHIDTIALASLPNVRGTVLLPTYEQQVAARTYVASHWSKAIA